MDHFARFHRGEGPRFLSNGCNFGLLLNLFTAFLTINCMAQSHDFPKSRMEGSQNCDFSTMEKIYNITDMIKCMNELASSAAASIVAQSSEGRQFSFPGSRRIQPYPYYQNPLKPSNDYPNYYNRKAYNYYPGSPSYQTGQSGYNDEGNTYPYSSDQPYSFSGGSTLLKALASIAQYDDYKCVPRILCEIATGVIPGNSGSRQLYEGGNSLISLLTAFNIGESSPLLTFGKSALTGYSSRGNPNVCYREYPRCPRTNAGLIDYLNNHNGGFFRFFGNVRQVHQRLNTQRNPYWSASRREPSIPSRTSTSEADPPEASELKFQSPDNQISRESPKMFFPARREFNNSDRIVFPQEILQGDRSTNRVSKSLNGHENSASDYQRSPFFPQGKMGPPSSALPGSIPSNPSQIEFESRQMMPSRKSRLYFPDERTNETTSLFTFPDGQKVHVNVAFSKLFSESYKKTSPGSFANDRSPQPVNLEGFSMVNLAELYHPTDKNRPELEVVHPCDMVCHDSNGTPVQFNQILLDSGSLNTLMSPDQPILDLSNSVPCEVMCIDRRGERRQHSTYLNQVVKTVDERQSSPNLMGSQDFSKNRRYQSVNQQRDPISLNPEIRNHIRIVRQQSPWVEQEPSDYEFSEIPSTDARISSGFQTDALAFNDFEGIGDTATQFNTRNRGGFVREEFKKFRRPPSPFFSLPLSFGSLSQLAQGPSAFLSQKSFESQGRVQLLRVQPTARKPTPKTISVQPNPQMIPPLSMMPVFPGLMPMFDPLANGMFPMVPFPSQPSIGCSTFMCRTSPQASQKMLVMCGGILYFIPFQITLPVCVTYLENKPSENSISSGRGITELPARWVNTSSSESPEDSSVPIKSKRHPGGADYPEESCLEGESWNRDADECVPMKYDPNIELDYTHLPGSPWSGATKTPKEASRRPTRRKVVILTDKSNVTYIKTS